MTGTIVHIEGNVALVKHWTDNCRMYKLSDLMSAEPQAPEPFKPGWYRIKYRPASNFVYYIAAETNNRLVYTHAFNPTSGEMEPWTSGSVVAVGKNLLNVGRGDLIKLKFTDA